MDRRTESNIRERLSHNYIEIGKSDDFIKWLDDRYLVLPKYNKGLWPKSSEDLKNVWFPEPTNATDHSYYNDANGKDLFYHFKNGVMNTEMYKGFLVGNIFKYITRHGKKDKSKTIEDLKKARDYLNELIDFEEAAMDESAEG